MLRVLHVIVPGVLAALLHTAAACADPPEPRTVAIATIQGAEEEALHDGVEMALEEWRQQPREAVAIDPQWVTIPAGVTAADLENLPGGVNPAAIIGRAPSAAATSLAQACNANKLPCVILSSFAMPDAESSYVFQLWPSLASSKGLFLTALRSSGARRVVILSYAQQSSSSELTALRTSLQKEGGINIVGYGNLTPGGGLPPDLDKLLGDTPDAIILDIPEGLVAPVASEIRARKFKGKILTPDPLPAAELKRSGSALEGITFAALGPPGGTARGAIRKRFGELPENVDLVRFAHDAMIILLETLADSDADNTPEGIRDYLQHRKRFEGYLGSFSFLPGGRASLPLIAYRNSGGTALALATAH
jgi:ABC-type branched-subunit amino acid transport system substrate-binding protein